ncbi:MAG: ABC transporter ATP-binding protein [Phycisphaerae bacterium]|jgi:ABC-type lipoprotein export system ATPase subunit
MSSRKNASLISARGLHKSYMMGRSPVRVLRGASLAATEGEFLAIMGASGSGKSTLLHILGALDLPDKGSVSFRGKDVFAMPAAARRALRCREIGFVFQFYHLLPECTVLENVLMPMMISQTAWRWLSSRRRARNETLELLNRVGLADRARHRPNELSGGERQRVAIARALANRPSLLLADEPTGNLDAAIGSDILDLLAELNQAGQTIIMVTHDPQVASRAHRCVTLGDGIIREAAVPDGADTLARVATREVTR